MALIISVSKTHKLRSTFLKSSNQNWNFWNKQNPTTLSYLRYCSPAGLKRSHSRPHIKRVKEKKKNSSKFQRHLLRIFRVVIQTPPHLSRPYSTTTCWYMGLGRGGGGECREYILAFFACNKQYPPPSNTHPQKNFLSSTPMFTIVARIWSIFSLEWEIDGWGGGFNKTIITIIMNTWPWSNGNAINGVDVIRI